MLAARKQQPTILVGAEPYGYGPASKLVTIVRALRAGGFHCVFVGTGSSLEFARLHVGLFDHVVERARESLDETVVGSDVSCIVSVMDDVLPLIARRSRIPCVLVDSLYWFWQWDYSDDDLRRLEEIVSLLLADSTTQAAVDRLCELAMHDAQYVAHRLADRVLAQRCGSSEESAGAARRRIAATEVGAIVTLDRTQARDGSNHDLVSISGLSNSLTDVGQANAWARAVLTLMWEAWSRVGEPRPMRVCGNASILNGLKADFDRGDFHVESFVDHADYRASLSRSHVLFAPPGLTSIIEAWSHGVPFFALPEQHYGHSLIMDRIAICDPSAFPNALISPQLRSSGMLEAETQNVLAKLVDIVNDVGSSFRSRLVSDISGAISLDADHRAELLLQQDRILGRTFGDADGADKVVRAVQDVNGRDPTIAS